jgi:hypothetical protein
MPIPHTHSLSRYVCCALSPLLSPCCCPPPAHPPVCFAAAQENNQFLMCAQKCPRNKTSNYHISKADNDLSKYSPNYLGKLRGNFLNTEYQVPLPFPSLAFPPPSASLSRAVTLSLSLSLISPQLFDNGRRPDDLKSVADVRKEVAAMIFTPSLVGSVGPRKIQVSIPLLEDSEIPINWTQQKVPSSSLSPSSSPHTSPALPCAPDSAGLRGSDDGSFTNTELTELISFRKQSAPLESRTQCLCPQLRRQSLNDFRQELSTRESERS